MEREVSQKLKKTKKMSTSESVTWDLSQAPFAKFMLHVRFFFGGGGGEQFLSKDVPKRVTLD